jgi:hypothetical protein
MRYNVFGSVITKRYEQRRFKMSELEDLPRHLAIPEQVFSTVLRCLELNKPIPSGEVYLKCARALNEGYEFRGTIKGTAILVHPFKED